MKCSLIFIPFLPPCLLLSSEAATQSLRAHCSKHKEAALRLKKLVNFQMPCALIIN